MTTKANLQATCSLFIVCLICACSPGATGGDRPVLNTSSCKDPDLGARAIVATVNGSFGVFRDAGYEKGGKLRYAALKDSDEWAAYENLTGCLRNLDPGALKTREEKLAFWINLYNALVVHGVLYAGIPSSVTDVDSFFDNTAYKIGGVRFSLEHIEHAVLRGNRSKYLRPWAPFSKDDPALRYALDTLDPRIHFALVCGAQSCPPLTGYTPETVDEQLDEATRNFLSATVTPTPNKKGLEISSILQWYEHDFGGREGVIELLRGSLEPGMARQILEAEKSPKISYFDYDWRLNDLP